MSAVSIDRQIARVTVEIEILQCSDAEMFATEIEEMEAVLATLIGFRAEQEAKVPG